MTSSLRVGRLRLWRGTMRNLDDKVLGWSWHLAWDRGDDVPPNERWAWELQLTRLPR